MSNLGTRLIGAIRNKDEKGEKTESEMSFFQHLEALRWHIVRAAAAILVFAVIAFIFFDNIFDGIIMAPTKANFWTYRMMCNAGASLHSIFSFLDPKGFCVDHLNVDLINTELGGQFNLQLNTSIMIGLILGPALPVI